MYEKTSSEICGKNYLPINNQVVTEPYRIKSPSRWGQTYLSEIASWRKHGGTKEAESRLKTPDNPDTKVGKNLAWKFKISSLMLCLENGEETRLKTEVAKDEDGVRKKVMRR